MPWSLGEVVVDCELRHLDKLEVQDPPGDREAAGLNNPGFEMQSEAGGRTGAAVVAVAAAASMSSP